MADTATEMPVVNETVNATAENVTAKIPATPEGMFVAYSSLVIMALVPIFLGSFRSVRYHKEQKDSGEKPETMSSKDAAMFPIIASCTLFGIYLVFQIFSKEYINMLLAVYFFFLGVLALAHIASPILHPLIPPLFPNQEYHMIFTQGPAEKKEEIVNWKFDRKDLLVILLSGAVGLWYLIKKHWVANNLFGLAFAVNGVEFLSLNSISTGCILLGGLFVYDVFWVFGTNVMVTVAKSFEAPIKLVFPQDLLENGLGASNFAMLGLGDIVIPGIFIALLLRFDISQKKESRVYFYASFLAYFLGLLLTIVVMHFFKHAQPALLYLVPACIGVPVFVALIRGEIKQLFSYEDHPEPEVKEGEKKDSAAETKTKKDK
ncbi:minor histocompatibility antigen H13-like [Mercenaria mercenaria]|uniref:minor histocompatibility antigen H13-like n=1 Tax=Mercenaria mercenaria TaxID=6596 RepID=UPI001E1DEB80|nr:minor histocompatibility antigen H13-like [Mercenaria mercenaria]